MSFFDFQRLDNILNLLIEKKDAVHINEISSYCNVSDRTIRSDINVINNYIKKHGAHIVLIRKQGYIIEYKNKETFDKFWKNQDTGTFLFTTSQSRLTYLIRLFLTTNEYITQEYLQSILFVSQNTLYNDFRTLRKYFSAYNLIINNKSNLGYILQGKEQNIRSAIINLIFKDKLSDYITAIITVDKEICNNINYELFNSIFLKYFSKDIRLDSDYFYRNIFSSCLLTASRVKSGHTITSFKQSIKLNLNASKMINIFLNELESSFDISLSSLEKEYIHFCIAENNPNLIDDVVIKSNQILAEEIVNSIHEHLISLINSPWVYDESLYKNLLEHIKLFLKVQIIEGNRNNPLLETIKNNFPFAFDIAISCCREVLKKYDIHFSEDEISYIALHFTNAIEKSKNSQLSLAIICGSGKTFSSIIETKIKQRFPNKFYEIVKYSFTEFQNNKNQKRFDIIVSTVPIKNTNFPIIQINLNDLETSMDKIEYNFSNLKLSYNSHKLFSEKRFTYLTKKSNKKEVLEKIYNTLLKQGFVNENFLQEVYDREEISSTIISDSIAIPHPIGKSIIKDTVYVVICPKGISWDDKIIKFVFLFSIKSNSSNQIQLVYDKLLDFISLEKLQTKLLKNPNYKTLLEIFDKN